MEADEKSVVKCIVISPKGKQKSLISVQHPCSIVNNRFFIPERPKKNNARVRSKLYIQKGLTHFSLPSIVNNSYTSLQNISFSQWILIHSNEDKTIIIKFNAALKSLNLFYYAMKHHIISNLIFLLLNNISWSCLWKPWHIHLIIIVAKNNILKK